MSNQTTELISYREVRTLLTGFLCEYQNILISRGINASEAVCKQNELIDEYAKRIEQAISATLGRKEIERKNSKLEHKMSNMETKLLKAQERIDELIQAATLESDREKRLELLVNQLWYLVNHRSGYGYAAALKVIEELGIEVDE